MDGKNAALKSHLLYKREGKGVIETVSSWWNEVTKNKSFIPG